jgi:hypothetical protein
MGGRGEILARFYMSAWKEYDPHTGVMETTVDNDEESDFLTVNKTQDVEGLLERNKTLRDSGATDIGIKNGLWMYASIPIAVQYELLKRGINVHSKWDRAKVLDVINSEYPYLKTTNKHHSIKRNRDITKANTSTPGPLLIVR